MQASHTCSNAASWWHAPSQALEIVRLLGIGRNEYIRILNDAKGRKLQWRINRSIVRDSFRQQPLPIQLHSWWQVQVVNVGTLGRGLPHDCYAATSAGWTVPLVIRRVGATHWSWTLSVSLSLCPHPSIDHSMLDLRPEIAKLWG